MAYIYAHHSLQRKEGEGEGRKNGIYFQHLGLNKINVYSYFEAKNPILKQGMKWQFCSSNEQRFWHVHPAISESSLMTFPIPCKRLLSGPWPGVH